MTCIRPLGKISGSKIDYEAIADQGRNVNFRMELCGSQSEDTFLTIHHEMGHIEYYMSYVQQPPIFRVCVFVVKERLYQGYCIRKHSLSVRYSRTMPSLFQDVVSAPNEPRPLFLLTIGWRQSCFPRSRGRLHQLCSAVGEESSSDGDRSKGERLGKYS